MVTGYYLPPDDGSRADLLDHLADTLPKYTERFRLMPDILATRRDDAAAFRYALHGADDAQAYAQHRTAHKNLLRDGGDGSGDWPLPLILSQSDLSFWTGTLVEVGGGATPPSGVVTSAAEADGIIPPPHVGVERSD